MRLSGSFAVSSLVSFFFIPSMRAQKESRRDPPSGWGGLRFASFSRLYEARPAALRPPSGSWPSLRVHSSERNLRIRSLIGVQSYTKKNGRWWASLPTSGRIVTRSRACIRSLRRSEPESDPTSSRWFRSRSPEGHSHPAQQPSRRWLTGHTQRRPRRWWPSS